MSLPPKGQQRGKSRSGSAQRSEAALSFRTQPVGLADQTARPSAEKKRELTLETLQITAGRAGERNLQLEWIDVPIGTGGNSVRFEIATAAEHGLEAVLEQQSYRRSYDGTSNLKTEPVPLGPIGTRGKLSVTDLTTGEVLKTTWVWTRVGLWQRLLGWVKEQFA